MPPLRELQSRFAAALLADGDGELPDDVAADGLTAAARIAIYRHHFLTSVTEALASIYPVVCRLVDRRFFAYAADRYIRQRPPAAPCLFEYGESFGDFLAQFPPCRGLAYLPDVARLEWAMNAALHAPDAPRLDPHALRALAPDDVTRATLRLHPSVALLESPWPVDAIWRANQPGADPESAVDLDAGAVRLEIRRLGDDVVFRALRQATFVFRRALARGDSLAGAAGAATAVDPAFDAAAAVCALFDEDVVVAA